MRVWWCTVCEASHVAQIVQVCATCKGHSHAVIWKGRETERKREMEMEIEG